MARWKGGLRFEAERAGGERLVMDEAGSGEFRPAELLLVALAGCTAMEVISILGKKRQVVTGYAVRVRGEVLVTGPRGAGPADPTATWCGRRASPETA